MQINFNAKKLKEANKYVSLLNPSNVKIPDKTKKRKEKSFLQKIVSVLFK